MTYSVDFRRKALAIKERENLSFEAAAERFGVGKASLVRWSARLGAGQQGVCKALKRLGISRKKNAVAPQGRRGGPPCLPGQD